MFTADAAREATAKITPFNTRISFIVNVLFRTSIMHACVHNKREATIIVRQYEYTLSVNDPCFWHTYQQTERLCGDVLDKMRKLGYTACVYHLFNDDEGNIPDALQFIIKW